MSRTALKKIVPVTARSISGAYDRFRNDNPLVVRKEFSMKDVFYRKDRPGRELLRVEAAFDTELYVLLIVLGIGTVWLFYRIVRGLEKRRVHCLEKAYLKSLREN